ncbi:MAG TPA: hypothetical protein VF730_02160 [Terracidiphilus sp.]
MNGRGGIAIGDAVAQPVRLIVYDDESRTSVAPGNTLRLLRQDRVDAPSVTPITKRCVLLASGAVMPVRRSNRCPSHDELEHRGTPTCHRLNPQPKRIDKRLILRGHFHTKVD